MKMLLTLALLIAVTSAGAQTKIQIFPVITEGQAVIQSIVSLKSGAEFYYYFGATGTRVELISPQLVWRGTNGRLGVGLYARFNDQIRQLGVAGAFSLGNARNWQLSGPYYLYLDRGKAGISYPAAWFPNLRLSYPVTPKLRLGPGFAFIATAGKQPTLLAGLHFQYFTDKTTNLQVRIGRFLSPTPMAGRLQLFTGISKAF